MGQLVYVDRFVYIFSLINLFTYLCIYLFIYLFPDLFVYLFYLFNGIFDIFVLTII